MNSNKRYTAYMYSYPHKKAYGKLENINFSDYKSLLYQQKSDLYIHVPFCKSKCGYCNLFSVTGQDMEYMTAYVDACAIQWKQYDIEGACFDTLTVGGGDPLVLSAELLYRLLSFGSEGIRIGIETSPNETTVEKLTILKTFHTERISIGVQSFWDSELRVLKRAHCADAAKRALNRLKECDFPIVNIDLIYGIPGQTILTLETSLQEALKFEPEEIFLYPLYVRKGTGITGMAVNENTYDLYQFASHFLISNGYIQISMRQFVKRIPKHTNNCGFENMLAIGCGGRSYLGNLHFCYPYAVGESKCLAIIDQFIKNKDKTGISHGYILNENEQKRRFIIKNLLYYHGIPLEEYRNIFNADLFTEYPLLVKWMADGYVKIQTGCLRLTSLGMSCSDYIGPMLQSREVQEKLREV